MIPWWIGLILLGIGALVTAFIFGLLPVNRRDERGDELRRLNCENEELKKRLGPRALY